MHIDLPSGQSAEFRDPATITERQRRPVRRALQHYWSALLVGAPVGPDGKPLDSPHADAQAWGAMSQADKDLVDEASDLMVIAMLASWTYTEDISIDALLGLPGPDYNLLRDKAADFADWFEGLDSGPSRDPQSPTVPSGT